MTCVNVRRMSDIPFRHWQRYPTVCQAAGIVTVTFTTFSELRPVVCKHASGYLPTLASSWHMLAHSPVSSLFAMVESHESPEAFLLNSFSCKILPLFCWKGKITPGGIYHRKEKDIRIERKGRANGRMVVQEQQMSTLAFERSWSPGFTLVSPQ